VQTKSPDFSGLFGIPGTQYLIPSPVGYLLYYPAGPLPQLEYIRGHWGVENNLHWCLDINFRENERRIRQGDAAENFSRLSRIALNLLKVLTGGA
jgi:hypothetical protein